VHLWPAAGISLLLLNASLTFENVWPTPKIRLGSSLSIELAAAVLLLVLAHRWAGRLARRALPAVWVVLVLGRYLAVTGPGLYGREFNLYWDSAHIGNVAAMLAKAAPWWLITSAAAATLLVIVLVYMLARVACMQVAAAVERGPRLAIGALASAVTLLFSAAPAREVNPHIASELRAGAIGVAFAHPVTPAYARQARSVLAMLGPGAVAPPLPESPPLDANLRALDGADVLLVFLESYGAVTYDAPDMATALAGSRAALDAAIRDTGRRVVSAYVESPTFGASSWLAHLSLLTGVDVRDQYTYASLMASDRETILAAFERRGYRTVGLMPGMRQAWPEGAFYGFDVIYGRDGLAYPGPDFGWWSIPDQYTLAKLDALERTKRPRAPVFAVFPTSTTHAPFGPVAPYQPDWGRLLTRDPYGAEEAARALAVRPDLTNLRPSYLRAMAYDLESLAGYVHQQADDPLLIVIGDHQPPAAVSGAGASWEVPVHVIGRRAEPLDRLLADGFRSGLTPARPSIGPMHALVPVFLNAFSEPED
jgi:hypothetical protein